MERTKIGDSVFQSRIGTDFILLTNLLCYHFSKNIFYSLLDNLIQEKTFKQGLRKTVSVFSRTITLSYGLNGTGYN